MTGFTIKSMARILPKEAARESWLGSFFRRCLRRFLSRVTYFSKPADRMSRSLPLRSEGVMIHGRSQRIARTQDRRRGVRDAHGHPGRHVVLPLLGLLPQRGPARVGAGQGEQGARRPRATPSTSTTSSASWPAPGPRSSTRPRPRSPRSSRRMASGSTTWSPRPMPRSRRPSRPAPRARSSRTPGPASRRSSTRTRASPTRTSSRRWTGSPSCSRTSPS